MKRGGRKTILTPPLQRKICALLERGHTVSAVCAATSIGERTFYEWREKHPQFSQATTCAIGKSKIALVNKLRHSDDWRAAAFLLERRWPNEFGRCDIRMLPKEPEAEETKKINVAFILPDLKGKTLAEVANFPVMTEEKAKARIEGGGHDEPEPSEPDRNGEFEASLAG